jgi:hypothetical protein
MLVVVYIIVLPFVFTNDIELSFIERSCVLNKKCVDNLVVGTKKIGTTDPTKTRCLLREYRSSSYNTDTGHATYGQVP